MKKTKLLIPLIPISLAPLGAITMPLTSCGGGGYKTEYVNVTVQCDEHCHATTPTTKIQKGYRWANAKYYFGITYDDGYDEYGAYINGERISESYVLNSDETITIKSCLYSERVQISFGSSNHSTYEGGAYTASYLKSQKWSEVIKPTVVADEGYTFNNIWFGDARITDDTLLGQISSGNYITVYPHIVSNNPNDTSNFTFSYDESAKTAKLTSINSFRDTHLYLPSTVNYNGSTYTITGVNFYDSWNYVCEITLPDTIETIEQISSKKVYKINMPKSLTTISANAFAIPNVESLDFSNTKLTTIGESSLNGCKLVKELYLPKTVTKINDYAFRNWNSLESIKVDEENTVYTSKEGDTECNCIVEIASNTLIQGSAKTTIPSTVTKIGVCAFNDLTGLTSIYIPKNVTDIVSYAYDANPFGGCTNLNSITVDTANTVYSSRDRSGNECKFLRKDYAIISGTNSTIFPTDSYTYSIAEKAFAQLNIKSLPSSSVTAIDKYAFENCKSLTSVELSNVYSGSIGEAAFKDCTNLQTIQLGSLTKISKECFSGCTNAELTASSFSTLTEIGENAFKGWKNITELTLSSSSVLTSLSGFADCPNLKTVNINTTTLTEIGANAFSGCDALTTVNFGTNSKVKTIGNYAFSYCKALNDVILPSELTTIGQDAFYSCKLFTTILIPNKVTTIGSSAFYGCENVNALYLGTSLTTIGDYAFRGLGGITSLIVPNSVTSIGGGAFDSCTKLEKVWIGSGVASIGSYGHAGIFGECPALAEIKVSTNNTKFTSRSEPDGVECNYIASLSSPGYKYLYAVCSTTTISSDVVGIKSYVYYGSHITSITIPAQITYIESSAFNSNQIKTVTLEAQFTEWPNNYSESAFDFVASRGTFIAPNSTVIDLVKTNWTIFNNYNWTFKC